MGKITYDFDSKCIRIFFPQFEWGNSTQTITETGIKHPGLKRLINACLFKISIGFVVAFCFFCHYMGGNLLLAVTFWKKNRTLLINNQRGNWKLVQTASFFFAFFSSFETLVSEKIKYPINSQKKCICKYLQGSLTKTKPTFEINL